MQSSTDPSAVGMDAERLARVGFHFARYVDDGRLPGWAIRVTRRGQIVLDERYGQRDVEAGTPVEPDTVFRIYSMTKPVTTVAAMVLFEQGAFELTEPLHRFVPAFRHTRVYRSGSALAPQTEPMRDPIRLWHLMTHTSGLTYGFLNAHPVDQRYRAAGFDWGVPPGADLAEVCDRLAAEPLVFQPGTEWNYSMATDVLGRVVEVASGQSLDAFLADHVFGPLGMVDTAFSCPETDHDRLAALYSPLPGDPSQMVRNDAAGAAALSPPTFLGGGGGLVSTVEDYHRFAEVLRRGGELDGVRLLSPRTVRLMMRNHLPGGADLTTFGRPLFAETAFDGTGFGLGGSVIIDPAATRTLGSAGEFAWGGAASTTFWVDRAEDLTAVMMTQLLPSSTHPLRTQLRQLVYQALVD